MEMTEGQEAQGMPPEAAMQMIQELGIPPEVLPQLYQALEALSAAGMMPGAEAQPPAPQGNPLDNAINEAKAQVMGGAQPAR